MIMIGISRHPINEADLAPVRKRLRQSICANDDTESCTEHEEEEQEQEDCMMVDDDDRNQCTTTTTKLQLKLPSQDDILIEMIQNSCGATTSNNDIVQFCLSSGIPMSRMLRLDLIRLNGNNKEQMN